MFLFHLFRILYRILDWWNGTYLDLENGIMVINYRYKLHKYIVHIPYNGNIGRRIATKKEKEIILNYQDGIDVLVDAQKIGYDEIKEEIFAD
jgi:hypothetical protein